MAISNRASQRETPGEAESPNGGSPAEADLLAGEDNSADVETKRPDLHIDIQVHIDATASPEQIDFIFASMAKHLYGHKS